MKRYFVDVGNKRMTVDVQDPSASGVCRIMVGDKWYKARVSKGKEIEDTWDVGEDVPEPAPAPVINVSVPDTSGPIVESIKALAERPQYDMAQLAEVVKFAVSKQGLPNSDELVNRIVDAIKGIRIVANIPAQPVDLNLNVAGTTSVVKRNAMGQIQSLESTPKIAKAEVVKRG